MFLEKIDIEMRWSNYKLHHERGFGCNAWLENKVAYLNIWLLPLCGKIKKQKQTKHYNMVHTLRGPHTLK